MRHVYVSYPSTILSLSCIALMLSTEGEHCPWVRPPRIVSAAGPSACCCMNGPQRERRDDATMQLQFLWGLPGIGVLCKRQPWQKWLRGAQISLRHLEDISLRCLPVGYYCTGISSMPLDRHMSLHSQLSSMGTYLCRHVDMYRTYVHSNR